MNTTAPARNNSALSHSEQAPFALAVFAAHLMGEDAASTRAQLRRIAPVVTAALDALMDGRGDDFAALDALTAATRDVLKPEWDAVVAAVAGKIELPVNGGIEPFLQGVLETGMWYGLVAGWELRDRVAGAAR